MLGFSAGACTQNRFDDFLLEGRKGRLVTIHVIRSCDQLCRQCGRFNRQRQGRRLDGRDRIDSIRPMRSVPF
jgi:hypothetical protein